MAHYAIYDDTGKILSRVNIPDIDKPLVLNGVNYLEGIAPENSYVFNNEFVAMPTKPDGVCVFDYTTKAWVVDETQAIEIGKIKRSALLSGCDWTQSSDSPLTTENKTLWATYRQALRDMTTEMYLSNTFPTPPSP